MTRNIYILIISLLATIAYAGNNPGIDFTRPVNRISPKSCS